MPDNIEKFLDKVAEAAEQSTLVKMTLSKPADKRDELRNVYVKPVLIKEKRLFAFTYRYERRDEVKNYDMSQMLEMLRDMLPERFQNATLFTVSEDVTLLVSSKGKATIQTKKVQESREQNLDHDKQKTAYDPMLNKCPFLRADYKCNIYENRPEVCRQFGQIEELPCKFRKK